MTVQKMNNVQRYYGFFGSVVHDVSWAKFILTEPIPLEVIHVNHKPNSVLTVWLALVMNTWSLTQRVFPPWSLTSSRKTFTL